jgi:hypothetical protein
MRCARAGAGAAYAVATTTVVEPPNAKPQVRGLANSKTPARKHVACRWPVVHLCCVTLTPLLILIIVLVVALCAAVRLFNLEHVDLSANILKIVTFSFSAKSRPQQEKPTAAPARRRGGRRRKRPGPP